MVLRRDNNVSKGRIVGIARGRGAIQCIQETNVCRYNNMCRASMQAGAMHALCRAGGARVATAVSSPAALHTVGQSVRAQRNRDEFTGVAGAVRVTWTLARSVACCWRGLRREGCGRRMRRSAECSSGRCRLSPCCCRELLPRGYTRPRARACCGGRWRLCGRWSPELARAAQRGRAHGFTAWRPCPPPRKVRWQLLEKFQRASRAACRDEVGSGRCSGRRCVWHARCGPCAGAGHGVASRSLSMSFAH